MHFAHYCDWKLLFFFCLPAKCFPHMYSHPMRSKTLVAIYALTGSFSKIAYVYYQDVEVGRLQLRHNNSGLGHFLFSLMT